MEYMPLETGFKKANKNADDQINLKGKKKFTGNKSILPDDYVT
jgi:hypothetical protein